MSKPVYDHPAAAEAAFYAAFAAVDSAAMEKVWATEVELLCVHPGGSLLRGKKAVMQSWIAIFARSDPPEIEHRLIGHFESGNLAVHLVEELIRPHGHSTSTPNRVLSTNVYVREAQSWCMAEHHASLPLVEHSDVNKVDRQLH